MKRLIFLSLFLFEIISAQTPVLNYLTSTDGGSAYEVFYYNNYLFVGAANTLEVWDLTGANNTPGNLRYKKRLRSNIDYITEHNGLIYVCANHDGLYKFEMTYLPDSLHQTAHYVPANINESIYDIAFYGTDTVMVAAKTKVNMLKETPDSFNFITTIASVPGAGRIEGVDIKDSLLSYTKCLAGLVNGVYLYNLKTYTQLAYKQDVWANPVDVYFDSNRDIIHVMGGQLIQFPFPVNGIYSVLDYTNPTSLNEIFRDTIMGYAAAGMSISNPMNAEFINDTIYIATQGGGPINYPGPPVPYEGQVYVYDVTDTSNIHLVTDLYAGLYHFDIDIDESNRNMYVASEWYGILTMDIGDVMNETELSTMITGGWCHGSAYSGNRLVEANEGFGIRLFNVDTIQKPHLIAQDTSVGFCRAVSISDDANYIYGWFLTKKTLRVYNANTLTLVSDTTFEGPFYWFSDFKKSRYHNNKVAVIDEPGLEPTKIIVANVSDPNNPFISNKREIVSLVDITFHLSGELFALSQDSILVFDPVSMNLLDAELPQGGGSQEFNAFTFSNDTLFVFCDGTGEGIYKYHYDTTSQTLTYIANSGYLMNSVDRIFMASDTGYIYISSTIDQLKALSKSNLTPVVVYDHGADYIKDDLWGVQDLYCKNGYVFLNEYMGQTSIFGAPNTVSVEEAEEIAPVIIYPNPANNYFIIDLGSTDESFVQIFSIDGRLMYSGDHFMDKIKLSTQGWPSGVYIVNVAVNGHRKMARLIVTE